VNIAGAIQVPSLPKALEEGLRMKPDNRDNTVLHVSDLSVALEDGKCPRQLWLRLGEAKEKPPTAGILLMWENGAGMHERLVEVIGKGLPPGWYIHSIESNVVLPGPVFGRYDIILEGPDNILITVDFKTLRGRAFGYLTEAKPAHALQVQSYMLPTNATGGLVFYADREGQNSAKQFFVTRDDEAVKSAIARALEIQAMNEPPEILLPKLIIGKNKGPDSVKLTMPWQCSYCSFLDVSCEGALKKNLRNLGIIGYIPGEQADFEPKKGFGKLKDLVESLRTDRVPF